MIWLARAAGLLAVFRDPAFPDQGQHILEALAGLRVVAGVGRFLNPSSSRHATAPANHSGHREHFR